MAKVLVVGGAGYIGSTACTWLLQHGHQVWVLDDLSTGNRSLLRPELLEHGRFIEAKAGDRAALVALFGREKFDCVMHFAAKALVAESVQKPAEYFENNVEQTRVLLETMLEHGIRRFIFSSSCAVFGDPGTSIIDEDLPKKPMNPYGETKLAVEQILEQLSRDRGLLSIALRYFNAAGTEPGMRVGELHDPETHLIPNILKAALDGRPVDLFGTDYGTPDGTCIRDYVHVWDIAAAHGSAMNRLLERRERYPGRFEAFNLGSESGYSNRQVIAACEKVLGRKIDVRERERRAGDPPRLVANSALARRELGFRTSGIEEIVSSSLNWERKRRGLLKKAVFLDRDGTINLDPGYLSDADQLVLLPEVGQALGALKRGGYTLVVVSNQSGVGRGLIRQEELSRIHEKMNRLLEPHSARIDHFELCYHHPKDDCECRKPKPKLIVDAALKLGLDPSVSYMVGDKHSDIEAGFNAACRGSVLVRTGYGKQTEAMFPRELISFTADSLMEAADWILSRES